ncbi:flagellar hook-length control protein FliK [Modicisalibacter ilicicola DSM 19980]|uniref:Flagellar hook-length control protein FliK n=1 Tax=Modicisalibacter ilicicola DSM 19980 TaxID=1121942 RepID=A0A1M4YZM2_9GAMM|nr:flagellar hook-length control protein FliK [Halomonas ilicicola]SHF11017.1 flagellar hook-length control protein FliK [Halomonas ilicicola DSM 19980]
MEISQLLTPQGASPATRNLKGEAGDGARFAELYKQAGHSAESSAGSLDGKDSLLKGVTQSGTVAALEKLMAGELAPGEEASLLDTLVDGGELPAQLSPLAQQITTLLAGDALNQAGMATGNVQGNPTDDSVLLKGGQVAGETTLAGIRQRLELIADAQRGDTLAQAPQAAGLNATNGAAGDARTTPRERLADIATLGATADKGALRHQALTAQGAASMPFQEGMPATATQASNTFFEAVATIDGGQSSLPGRAGAESLANPALLSTAGNTSGSTALNGMSQPQGLPQPALSAPLASAQWQQGLGQQLVAMHQRGDQRVDLHLHPAELGPVSISLKLDDQLAQAQFASTNPQVRAAIEQAIPQLREALAESGIQLGEAMVGEHRQRDSDQSAEQGKAVPADVATGSPDDVDTESPTVSEGIAPSGRINLYA